MIKAFVVWLLCAAAGAAEIGAYVDSDMQVALTDDPCRDEKILASFEGVAPKLLRQASRRALDGSRVVEGCSIAVLTDQGRFVYIRWSDGTASIFQRQAFSSTHI